MIAGNERAHLAASHLEVFASGVEIGANAADFGIDVLQVVSGGFGGEFGVNASINRGQLGGGVLNGFGGFGARFLQLTLGDLEQVMHRMAEHFDEAVAFLGP